VRDEGDHPRHSRSGEGDAPVAERAFRQPPPLHGRESHIRIFEDSAEEREREVYGETQVSRDGSLPQEEHGPSAVLKALDPFWTRGIIPGSKDDSEQAEGNTT
jgi:hypothetical protein